MAKADVLECNPHLKGEDFCTVVSQWAKYFSMRFCMSFVELVINVDNYFSNAVWLHELVGDK